MRSIMNRRASRYYLHATTKTATTTTATTTTATKTIARAISSANLTIQRHPPLENTNTTNNNGEMMMMMPPKEELQFGKTFSPHMLLCHYKTSKNGNSGQWEHPQIVPFQDLKLSPAASSLHYGLQCFEGMKAYKTINDETDIRLFRPELNMKRLKNSMDRLAMPGSNFDPEELIRCIGELVRVGK